MKLQNAAFRIDEAIQPDGAGSALGFSKLHITHSLALCAPAAARDVACVADFTKTSSYETGSLTCDHRYQPTALPFATTSDYDVCVRILALLPSQCVRIAALCAPAWNSHQYTRLLGSAIGMGSRAKHKSNHRHKHTFTEDLHQGELLRRRG